MNENRRHPRYDFGGSAMLVFESPDKRRTLAITNYRNVSRGGACILAPETVGFSIGETVCLMPERYRRKRKAMIVNLGTGRLHLELPTTEEFSEFELAEFLGQFESALKG